MVKGYDITPQLVLSAYNTQIQFCRKQRVSEEGCKQKTDSEYADDLKEWLDGTKIKAIIVDPSAASFIAELRKRGYKVLKANNDVLDGIRLVGMLLNLGMLAFSSSCVETIKEFTSYIWDEKAMERGEDKPVKQHDHSMDAVRYFVSTILGHKLARMKEVRG